MKKLRLPTILFVCFITIISCIPPKKEKVSQIKDENQTEIDTVLADKLGADEYGMKNYVMALLRKGPKRWKIDTTTAKTLQKGHLQNISRLADEGKLIVAGPFSDDTDLRGIYIFDVKTVEEAQKLCETDPAILAGWLTMELHPWYSSASLMQTNEVYKKIARKKI